MIKKDILEDIIGDAGGVESFGQTFTHLQGLGGVFQHHGIPRDQRWRDGVDRRLDDPQALDVGSRLQSTATQTPGFDIVEI